MDRYGHLYGAMVGPMTCPAIRNTKAAVAIERKYVQTPMAFEQRADAEKQEIYRRLRGA